MLLRSYVNSFHSRCLFTLDLFLDCDDNACFYAEYNAYRKNKAAGKDVSCASSIQTHLFTLEIEQFVCFKVLSDLLKGRWIVPVCFCVSVSHCRFRAIASRNRGNSSRWWRWLPAKCSHSNAARFRWNSKWNRWTWREKSCCRTSRAFWKSITRWNGLSTCLPGTVRVARIRIRWMMEWVCM